MSLFNKAASIVFALLLGGAALVFISTSVPDTPQHEVDASSATVYGRIVRAQAVTLPNGLELVVIPDEHAAQVVHMVWYKVGAIDDPPGSSGIAHFAEHLTFSGTKNFSEQAFWRTLEKVGNKQDALTSKDFTTYYQTVSPKDLEIVMQLEAERMTNVQVSAGADAAERDAVLQERQTSASDPQSKLTQAIEAKLYENHRYGMPVDGRAGEMDSITLDDALDFYRKRYAPNNALVVIYGPTSLDQVQPLATKYYGALPARPLPPRRVPDATLAANAEQIVLRENRVREPVWERQYLAPSYGTGSSFQVHALQLIRQLLAGNATSRLHQALIVRKGLAKEVIVQYDPDALGPTIFSIHVELKRGADATEVQRAVEQELRALAGDGPAPDELARAQQNITIDTAAFEPDLPLAAQVVGHALVRGRKIEDVKAWPKRIASVVPHQVADAAQAVFVRGRSVTGLLLPR